MAVGRVLHERISRVRRLQTMRDQRCGGERAEADQLDGLPQGHHASPTVLVDGLDVMTGTAAGGGASCRLDLPTPERLRQAIGASTSDDDDAGSYPPELAVGVTSERLPVPYLHPTSWAGCWPSCTIMT